MYGTVSHAARTIAANMVATIDEHEEKFRMRASYQMGAFLSMTWDAMIAWGPGLPVSSSMRIDRR